MNTNTQDTHAAPMDMAAEIARLRQENANLRAKATGAGLKVSDKGGVSVYGLGRFPVTLYAGQWNELFTKVDSIKAFISANADILAKKEQAS